MAREAVEIGGRAIKPGTNETVMLPVAETFLRQGVRMPVQVFHGKRSGPSLFISAAIHGDELNGIEIIRRLTNLKRLTSLAGTLYTVPVVNIYGFITNSRYLPDRRDLNRFFPGSAKGSLASSVAEVLFKNVVSRCGFGIDLHTGSNHRRNIPHLRGDMSDEAVRMMAEAFGAPLVLDSQGTEGSLRKAAVAQGLKMLVFEGGEALRFDEMSIKMGLRGIVSVMEHLGMLKARRRKAARPRHFEIVKQRKWARATASGLFLPKIRLGQSVSKGEHIGAIHDPVGGKAVAQRSPRQGIVIGLQALPSVYKGDALLHIANVESASKADATVDEYSALMEENNSAE